MIRDSNGITEEEKLWLFFFFTKKAPAAALNSRLELKPPRFTRSADGAHKQLELFVEFLNALLATFETKDVIAEAV